MKVAITYHEDFGKTGFSVLKERIRPSFEELMESGLVDGIDVQVFRRACCRWSWWSRLTPRLIWPIWQTDPYREVAMLSAGSVMMAAEMVATGQAGVGLCLHRDGRPPCLAGQLLGLLLLQRRGDRHTRV